MKPNHPKQRINILYIIDHLWGRGGTENHVYQLARYLNKDRFRSFIVAFDGGELFVEKIRADGIVVYHIPVGRYYTPRAIRKALELKDIIRRNTIDIVQTFHYKSDVYGTLVSTLSGVKHIISSRRDMADTKSKLQIYISQLMGKRVQKFITVCEAVGDRLEKNENVDKSRRITIYNGIDTEAVKTPNYLTKGKVRRMLGIREEDFVVGMVAHFRPEKSHDIFLRSIVDVRKRIQSLRVLLVGSGPTLQWCKDFCARYCMEEDVIFTGMVDNAVTYLPAMDIACLVPGRNEGFSNAILEKMGMGKPLVVTSVGGNPEAVIDGVNGIVIPPYNVERLSHAIVSLYHDPSSRETMGRRSRERVEELFSLAKMIGEHERLYVELLEH